MIGVDFIKLRSELISGDLSFTKLMMYQEEFKNAMSDLDDINNAEMESMIYLCLDIYTYDDDGRVLISDREYDILMNTWIDRGNERIIYPDSLKMGTTWNLIKHEDRGTVGSLSKVYSEEDMALWLTGETKETLSPNSTNLQRNYIVAPKFDGVSGSIRIENRKIKYGATRRDGEVGMDITQLVRRMSNSNSFLDSFERQFYHLFDEEVECDNGFMKVEFVVPSSLFNQLILEKTYSNRRSATTGIINTPKNIDLGKYVYIVPLLFKDDRYDDKVFYAPPYSTRVISKDPSCIIEEIIRVMNECRLPQFPIRVDGAVVYEANSNRLNANDYMECGMAFKCNTAEAPTTIKRGYMSIGRLGKATPMVEVEPVEVNETIVTDVSLGSYSKYLGRNLHEDERVIIFSAGDVIPQLKPFEEPQYPIGAKMLKIDLRCPHCEKELTRVGAEYACQNEECPRVVSGKIANFVTKIGGKNISDGTVFELYDFGAARTIPELFTVAVPRMQQWKIKGWDTISITNLETELKRLRTTPIEVSKLIGAMGIKGIAKKKCRAIFRETTLEFLLKSKKKEIEFFLLGVDGFAQKSAETFAEWMKENREQLKEILELFTIVPDKPYKGSVVFTGFRSEELEERFDELGYETVNNVISNTIAVITASKKSTSGKCIDAFNKGIDIVHRNDVEELIHELEKKNLLNR